MKIFETDVKQRAFDGQWMLMAKVPDYENSYRHRAENMKMTTLVPHIWIILDVASDKDNLKKGYQF